MGPLQGPPAAAGKGCLAAACLTATCVFAVREGVTIYYQLSLYIARYANE